MYIEKHFREGRNVAHLGKFIRKFTYFYLLYNVPYKMKHNTSRLAYCENSTCQKVSENLCFCLLFLKLCCKHLFKLPVIKLLTWLRMYRHMSHLTNSREWAPFGEGNSSSAGPEVTAIYGTQKSFTMFVSSYLKNIVMFDHCKCCYCMFTRIHHLSLSWSWLIQSILSHPVS